MIGLIVYKSNEVIQQLSTGASTYNSVLPPALGRILFTPRTFPKDHVPLENPRIHI
jgi:hypothetical protein